MLRVATFLLIPDCGLNHPETQAALFAGIFFSPISKREEPNISRLAHRAVDIIRVSIGVESHISSSPFSAWGLVRSLPAAACWSSWSLVSILPGRRSTDDLIVD